MDRDEDSELSAAIKAQATRYAVPPGLRSRIVTAVSQADSAHAAAAAPRRSFRTLRTLWQRWGSMGAAFVCGVIASLVFGPFFASQGEEDRLTQEVVAGHVRSLMAAHLADVASSDRHTVKPWFSGKLDYSPPVHDLAQEGFPLQGGRLDYLDRRPVAALVYRRQQHTINLFVWPVSRNSVHAVKLLSRQGYNIAEWREQGMQFWAVSDLNPGELQGFAQQFQSLHQQ